MDPRKGTSCGTAGLACVLGIRSAALLVTDVIAALRWEGYSYRDQTVSELAAIGAPTRPLAVTLGLAGSALLVAFGVGV
jgi:hypothetical protein